jgi:hypothetical protein
MKKKNPCLCGFCRKAPYIGSYATFDKNKKDTGVRSFSVECNSCNYIKVKTDIMDSEDLAIEVWNDAWEQSKL